jgi:mRNA interferase HigB
MRIVSRKKLREFWERNPDAQQSLEDWYKDTKAATWKKPTEIKDIYRNASFVANQRVVFNIKGNKYRLVVAINYEYSMVYIRFIGTHDEYNQTDVTLV